MYAVQKIFDGPFEFDVFFESASAKQKLTCECREKHVHWFLGLTHCYSASLMDQGIKALSKAYNERFDVVFPVPPSYPSSDAAALKEFSKALTSNLIGGLGYLYGTSIVDR